jgi:hypothetical protein
VIKYALLIPMLLALLLGFDTKEANAKGGFHFRSGGIHIDFGRPHHGHGHGHYGGHWSGGYGHGYWDSYGGWGGHRHWHDTTHLDYHPGSYIRHYDHYDYVPGHYHLHHDGHWDYYDF